LAAVKFTVDVPVRWSDMDAYGHVNHARTVTLLEEARSELLFREMPRRGLGRITDGIVVSKLSVEYLMPLGYDDSPVLVEIWVTEVWAAWFVLRYTVRRATDSRVLATAQTTMVAYDLQRAGPRRLTTAEQDFLALWMVDETAGDAARA
jgi:acyl-CoA thioester hydrolase